MSKRLDYIDIYRGLGIITMIMGHIGYGNGFDKFIHAFHMPMFFWISGFFYKRNIGIKEQIKKKAKALLLPYIAFCIVYFLINIKHEYVISALFHILLINTEGLPIAGALWFLTALFFTDIIYLLLDKWNIKWLILPLVVVGSYADSMLPIPLPWALSASFVGLGLYWIGNLVRENEDKFYRILNMKWGGELLLVSVLTVISIFTNGYINMRMGQYAFLPLFWLNVILSVFIGVSVSKIIERTFGNQLIGRWLISIGRNSIVYVCLNQIVILYLIRIPIALPSSILKVMIFVFSMAILYILSILFTKTKLKILIGKF